MIIFCLQRWFLDGRVECFRDPGHIALGLLAVVVIVLLALLIPTMAIFTLIGKPEHINQCAYNVRTREASVGKYALLYARSPWSEHTVVLQVWTSLRLPPLSLQCHYSERLTR